MSWLIDCDERNSFLFFFPSENIRGQHGYQGRNLSKKVRRGSKYSLFESLPKTMEMFICSSSVYKWAIHARHEVGDVLKLEAEVPPGRLFGPHCLCAYSRWGSVPIMAKMPDIQRIFRPADQRRMLCNKLLCPLKEALGQNSQHWFSSFLSALWDKCQQLIISKPFSKLSIHMWPSSVCKKEKIGGGRGLISPQSVVFTSETSGVLACRHPKPGLFSNLSSHVFQRRELYWFWCGIAGSTASFVCPVLDPELVYPPYRAQIDKCQGGKPRRDGPACVKRCSIKA